LSLSATSSSLINFALVPLNFKIAIDWFISPTDSTSGLPCSRVITLDISEVLSDKISAAFKII
jgi:hypothetical protein